jgi:drug/metabolite transporter (DMT)-like permease
MPSPARKPCPATFVMKNLSPALRGIAWMIAAVIAWSGMYLFVRQVSGRFPAFEILAVRNAVTLALMAPMLFRTPLSSLRTTRWRMHVLRAVFACLGMAGLYAGIAYLPLPDVVALSFTQPLFLVALAPLVLGERVGAGRWIAALVGFAGVLLIVRPGVTEIGIGAMLILGSAALYAGSNVCVKLLMRTDSAVQSVFYGNLLMLPLSLVPALFLWVQPGWIDLAIMAAVGITGALGMYAVAQAYRAADASAVAPFDFLRLPITAGAGYLIFGDVAGPWTWAGALVIFGASYALVLIESRNRPAG